jgi:cell division protein FtsQ
MQETQKGKKRTMQIAGAMVILLTVILLLCVSITKVEVTGNQKYTSEEITELLFPDKLSRNTLFCFMRNRLKEHIQIPFVEDYDIIFKGPRQVEVILYEKSVVGYVSYMSSYMYFDKDGIIVESANEALPGVPLVTGLKFGQIVLYQKLPLDKEEIFQEILNLTQILSIYHMLVDRIQFGEYGEITLYLGEIEVLMGTGGNLNSKVSELNDMLPHLEGRSGILHLEDYDESDIRAGYTLEPRS